MPHIIYLSAVLLELIFSLCFTVFWISLIYSDLKGSPFVASKVKEIKYILKEAHLKKGQKFYDLGCGDGRVVRKAVELYGVCGVGIDVNPCLIYWSRLMSKFQKLKNVAFKVGDISKIDFRDAQVIYIFLMPKFLKILQPQLKAKLRPNTLVISHGFKLEEMKNRLFKTIPHTPFPTYFYRI